MTLENSLSESNLSHSVVTRESIGERKLHMLLLALLRKGLAKNVINKKINIG